MHNYSMYLLGGWTHRRSTWNDLEQSLARQRGREAKSERTSKTMLKHREGRRAIEAADGQVGTLPAVLVS